MYSQKYHQNFLIKIWLFSLMLLITLIILIGGLTRLTDSGLSITSWELFVGFLPPLNNSDWIRYFDLYKEIPEFKKQNFNMTIDEFKIIFWWEWVHRQLGRFIGLVTLLPMIYFSLKYGFWVVKKYGFIFLLICFQGFIGWYMVSSGLVERVDVSHYRLSLHLTIAFVILSIIFWKFLELTNVKSMEIPIKLFQVKTFLLLLFIQLIFGAFVSGMDAGTIYNTWPLMGTSYFPDDSKFLEFFEINFLADPSLMQFIHRNLAYIIFFYYLYLLFIVIKTKISFFYVPILIIGLILLFQIFLGVLTILSGVKIIYASLHQINSILIILSTLYFLYICRYKKIF